MTIIFLCALLLRVLTLDTHGFWIDEVASLDGASLGFPTFISGRFGYHANQPPLHYALVWLTSLMADPTTTTFVGRLPSALAGAFTVPVIYGLGKELFGKAQGIIAALLLAISTVHLNYSQDLRPYSLLVLLTTLSVYCLVRADRTDSPKWWAAFVLSMIGNALNSYVAMTFATPPILLFLAWVLWKKWRTRRETPGTFTPAVIATALVGVGLLVSGLDMLGAPRTSPDISRFALSSGLFSVPELLTWFTQFGLAGSLERLLQLTLFGIALVGLLAAVANPARTARRYEGAVICILFIVFPSLALSFFATSTAVFQRYALFVIVFYFLLISHGAVTLYNLLPVRASESATRAWRGVSILLGVAVLSAFILGAYNYFDPQQHQKVAFRPDFRTVASYLANKVRPHDTVIFLDDTGHGYTVTNFYWHNKPPTAIYDARDPLLFSHPLDGGDIYWVTTFSDLSALDRIAQPDLGWAEVASFELVRVLHEVHPTSTADSMSRIVDTLTTLLPDYQPVVTLQGCIQQGRGQIEAAAATYRRAGTFFPIGADYQRTAEGYSSLGNELFAWRDALLSKYLQPFRPELHRWLAAQLQQKHFDTESQAETEIANALEAEAAAR
ncbi:MAG: glycosyltransferase family 39 protein [Chloroflexota bacterium]